VDYEKSSKRSFAAGDPDQEPFIAFVPALLVSILLALLPQLHRAGAYGSFLRTGLAAVAYRALHSRADLDHMSVMSGSPATPATPSAPTVG
jgi:hypothetical protein